MQQRTTGVVGTMDSCCDYGAGCGELIAGLPGVRGRRIGVIENHGMIRRAVAVLLRGAGFEVMVAVDGEAALAEWSPGAVPDVIVSDYHLTAGTNGIAAIEALRARFGRVIPAIVTTADGSDVPAKAAAGAGCALLLKPTEPGELLAAIVRALG